MSHDASSLASAPGQSASRLRLTCIPFLDRHWGSEQLARIRWSVHSEAQTVPCICAYVCTHLPRTGASGWQRSGTPRGASRHGLAPSTPRRRRWPSTGELQPGWQAQAKGAPTHVPKHSALTPPPLPLTPLTAPLVCPGLETPAPLTAALVLPERKGPQGPRALVACWRTAQPGAPQRPQCLGRGPVQAPGMGGAVGKQKRPSAVSFGGVEELLHLQGQGPLEAHTSSRGVQQGERHGLSRDGYARAQQVLLLHLLEQQSKALTSDLQHSQPAQQEQQPRQGQDGPAVHWAQSGAGAGHTQGFQGGDVGSTSNDGQVPRPPQISWSTVQGSPKAHEEGTVHGPSTQHAGALGLLEEAVANRMARAGGLGGPSVSGVSTRDQSIAHLREAASSLLRKEVAQLSLQAVARERQWLEGPYQKEPSTSKGSYQDAQNTSKGPNQDAPNTSKGLYQDVPSTSNQTMGVSGALTRMFAPETGSRNHVLALHRAQLPLAMESPASSAPGAAASDIGPLSHM